MITEQMVDEVLTAYLRTEERIFVAAFFGILFIAIYSFFVKQKSEKICGIIVVVVFLFFSVYYANYFLKIQALIDKDNPSVDSCIAELTDNYESSKGSLHVYDFENDKHLVLRTGGTRSYTHPDFALHLGRVYKFWYTSELEILIKVEQIDTSQDTQ